MHSDAIEHSKRVGANIRAAGPLGYGFLTDANVAAANTVAGIRALIVAVGGAHSVEVPSKDRFNTAIDYGVATGELTDALIAPLTTVAGLIALTQNADTRREQMLG